MVVPAAKGILAALNDHHPDAIMVEFGDGIMGHYGVDLLLKDAELMSHAARTSSAPTTSSAAWGGLLFLGDLGLPSIASPARPPTTARAWTISSTFRHAGASTPARPGPTGAAD